MNFCRYKCLQLVVELANVTQKVQENEPETLVYYAFSTTNTNEIIMTERCVYVYCSSPFPQLATSLSDLF